MSEVNEQDVVSTCRLCKEETQPDSLGYCPKCGAKWEPIPEEQQESTDCRAKTLLERLEQGADKLPTGEPVAAHMVEEPATRGELVTLPAMGVCSCGDATRVGIGDGSGGTIAVCQVADKPECQEKLLASLEKDEPGREKVEQMPPPEMPEAEEEEEPEVVTVESVADEMYAMHGELAIELANRLSANMGLGEIATNPALLQAAAVMLQTEQLIRLHGAAAQLSQIQLHSVAVAAEEAAKKVQPVHGQIINDPPKQRRGGKRRRGRVHR